jgi:hypothetical protein
MPPTSRRNWPPARACNSSARSVVKASSPGGGSSARWDQTAEEGDRTRSDVAIVFVRRSGAGTGVGTLPGQHFGQHRRAQSHVTRRDVMGIPAKKALQIKISVM